MQQSETVGYRERILPGLFIVMGVWVMAVSLAADLLRRGSWSGFGPNQASLALSGFIVVLTGVILISSSGKRQIAEWLLVAIGAIAVSLAADLYAFGGVINGTAKQILVVSIGFAVLATGVIPSSLPVWRSRDEWPQLLRVHRQELGKFVTIIAQLALLVLVFRRYELENQAFYHNISLLIFYGFIIHFFLPSHYRRPFFLALSLVAITGIFGLTNGLWLIVIGLALIGICHLPLSMQMRLALLLVAAGGLVAFRVAWFEAPWPGVIWPVLGSMFMFRLIIYLYDISHGETSDTISGRLSYFFLLPNVVFPFFPTVDYSTFRRTYYDSDQYEIYQTGVRWIAAGVLHLILYRFVNYYVAIAPEEITNSSQLVRFVVSNYLLYLRVSGQFHLIIGILHLFGFNLPRTHHLYFLASSFTDLWRRINIYWKDFMLKVFFYPAYFRLRKLNPTSRLVVATLFVFVATWFFHAYQWFWLRGSFLFTSQDILFWSILTVFVVGNTLYENKWGRKRSLTKVILAPRQVAVLAMQTAATFLTMCILWALWTGDSIADWLSLWSIVGGPLAGLRLLLIVFSTTAVIFGLWIWISQKGSELAEQRDVKAGFFRPAAANGMALLFIFLIANPAVYSRLGAPAEGVMADLRAARLSDRDAALLQRGYYEDLIGVSRFNSELWDIYSKRPSDWPLIQDTELARLVNDFRIVELVPSTNATFHGARFSVNEWGMRDQSYARIPPPNSYRIALLGPSFVMGSGVADHETFEWLLEAQLNAEFSQQRETSYEILNFAVAGHSALQELWILEEEAFSFQPDAIFFVAHQLEEEIAVRNLANRLMLGIDIPYDYLNEVAEQAGVEAGMTPAEIERRLAPYSTDIVTWTYHRVVSLAEERDIVPVWIFMPTLESPTPPEMVEHLTALAEDAGFAIVSLADVYQNHDLQSIIVADWDRHPNAAGHRLVAERLFAALKELELLGPVLLRSN